jgi:molybdenum cofactor cytidylyltransferase
MSDTPQSAVKRDAQIAAIVLAAGQSSRMGRPKMILHWGQTSVIGKVVANLEGAGVDQIVVVTGGARQQVEAALQGLPVRTVYNPDFATGDMLSSLQAGLASQVEPVEAVLVVLGDQPQIDPNLVREIIALYRRVGSGLVVPSYHMHRGHPWLVVRSFWPEILALEAPATLRDFLNAHQDEIHYLPVETEDILKDLDTPDDYQRYQPGETDRLPKKSRTIVIVEDEPETAEMFAEMMRLSGYRVLKSYGGASAVSLIARSRPAAVVMDLMMPDFSGLDVLRTMHSDPGLASIPVIVVSAKSQPADIENGLKAGASAYLTKPVAFLDLKTAVETAIFYRE